MLGRIYRTIIGFGIICGALCALLVGIYHKGWNDATVKMRLAENTQIISMVGKKEKIDAEIAKKTVADKRKALSRYVIKEN